MLSAAWRYIAPPLFVIVVAALLWIYPRTRLAKRLPLGAWSLPLLGATSCLFLMYYLPPTSWWRFVAWLMIGLSVYLSYSYSRSQIGRALGRPEKTPGWLMLLGLGSLLIAVGILIVPHDASLKELLGKLNAGFAEGKSTFIAVSSIAIGLVLSVAALIVGFLKGEKQSP